jgi:hypothetical protein
MARSTAEIKSLITTPFIANQRIVSAYGLTPGQTFEQQFSLVSIENILFSIIAFVISVHESIVEKNAENSRPQNLPNFRISVMNFLDGLSLVWKDGAFNYDLTGITDAAELKIIDRCAVLESDDGELVVKIATDNAGVLEPVTPDQKTRVEAYIKQIKVPGVKVRLVNDVADQMKMNLTVYVDPLVIDLTTGRQLNATGEVYPVKDAISNYLGNLEFNGAFVRDHFRSVVKAAQGIELVTTDSLQWKIDALPFVEIGEWKVPESGYFAVTEDNLTINYQPYAVVYS